MATYPYVPAYFDNLGRRKGPTYGLLFHMAEGGGTVGYLDRNGAPPARGVSVHAVCEYSGRVVRMLDWDDASGSLNPSDRSTDKSYYGHSILVDVLGDWWRDPNSVVISMEIEGFAKDGPNANQVRGAIAWGLDMRSRYPSIRGAIGHADQTDTKGCPGTTPAMRSIFAGVGGHGLFRASQENTLNRLNIPPVPTNIVVNAGATLYDNSGGVANANTITVSPARTMPLVGSGDGWRVVEYVNEQGVESGFGYYVKATECGLQTVVPAPVPVDCKQQIADAIAADRAKAHPELRVSWD